MSEGMKPALRALQSSIRVARLQLQKADSEYHENRGKVQGWEMKVDILKERLGEGSGQVSGQKNVQQEQLQRAMEHNNKLADVVHSLQTRLDHSRQLAAARSTSHLQVVLCSVQLRVL